MASYVWGDEKTKFFTELTPDRILQGVESAGYRCTGRVLPLNSMENRVFEVEVEAPDAETKYDHSKIIKFYRPGRWSDAQILDEHQFIQDLVDDEIPAVAPIKFPDGKTLSHLAGLAFCIFPKVGGRNPDEFTFEQLEMLGRLLARMHAVGNSKKAEHRLKLTPDTFGLPNLEHLLASGQIPIDLKSQYTSLVEEICKTSTPLFKNIPLQRIHGDCHLGNILWSQSGPFFIDFDDMTQGPVCQDIWLTIPGRDKYARQNREILIEAYNTMAPFPRESLALIEPLRALRLIHFSAWINKRWQDQAFKRTFPNFGTYNYWLEQIQDLKEINHLIQTQT